MKKIKNITTFSIDNNEAPIKTEFLQYDKSGNLILSIKYNESGETIEKSEFKFNDKNQKTEEKQYTSETELAEEHFFIYNENGELKEIKKQFAEGYEAHRVIEIDKETGSRTELELDENGEIEERHIWKFEEGLLFEQAEYDDNEKLVRKTTYQYDKDKRLIKECEFEKKDKKPIQSKKYIYNSDTKKINELQILNRKGKIINNFHINYDDKDRVIKQVSPLSGNIQIEYPNDLERIEKNTDINGNIISETKFIHDEFHNLIREEAPLSSKEYKIEYFQEN